MVDVKSVGQDDGLTLSRWSRLKRRGGETAVAPSTETPAAPELANKATLPTAGAADVANEVELSLPQLSSISLVEDFTPFMQAKVPQALRQQALKALFKEPHFNVMDGLDTYIDDYTVFEPISPEVMATLSSWKTIMNPTQQVVTPGGYAVDVESDEGKAVLAARAEAEALEATEAATEQGVSLAASGGCGGEDEESGDLPEPTLVASITSAPIQHRRHNKRVSDFTYVDASAVVDTPPLGTEKPK